MEHVLLHVVVHHVARELTLVLELPRLNDAVFVHVVVLTGCKNICCGCCLDSWHTCGDVVLIFNSRNTTRILPIIIYLAFRICVLGIHTAIDRHTFGHEEGVAS